MGADMEQVSMIDCCTCFALVACSATEYQCGQHIPCLPCLISHISLSIGLETHGDSLLTKPQIILLQIDLHLQEDTNCSIDRYLSNSIYVASYDKYWTCHSSISLRSYVSLLSLASCHAPFRASVYLKLDLLSRIAGAKTEKQPPRRFNVVRILDDFGTSLKFISPKHKQALYNIELTRISTGAN
ncbi:hypothetical protein KVT40_003924 [Elsinoe batatas]|uniref:Uncharacterized protein n=1 Tax=Elsinoe batatas TaxID=2601811 RepID=A0A8K0PFN2_9PEZI|nr:hypothetical protein KVT40_003924 [Elsinoe batatas]